MCIYIYIHICYNDDTNNDNNSDDNNNDNNDTIACGDEACENGATPNDYETVSISNILGVINVNLMSIMITSTIMTIKISTTWPWRRSPWKRATLHNNNKKHNANSIRISVSIIIMIIISSSSSIVASEAKPAKMGDAAPAVERKNQGQAHLLVLVKYV